MDVITEPKGELRRHMKIELSKSGRVHAAWVKKKKVAAADRRRRWRWRTVLVRRAAQCSSFLSGEIALPPCILSSPPSQVERVEKDGRRRRRPDGFF